MTREDVPAHDESSGNVFAGLGLPAAEEELLKAQLTLRIDRAIRERGLSRRRRRSCVVAVLAVPAPAVTHLLVG